MNRIEFTKTNSSFNLFELIKATIDSIGKEGVMAAMLSNTDDISKWCLLLECSSYIEKSLNEFEICVYVTDNGNEKEDSHQLVDILKYAGFKVNESEIFDEEWALKRLEK